MITVISIQELEKLMRNKKITQSENTEFIANNELRGIIMSLISNTTGEVVRGGFITVLCGVDNDVDTTVLETKTSEILLKLPRPKEPIYLNLDDTLKGVKIDSGALGQIIKLDLTDDQLRSVVSDMFESDIVLGVDYDYAFLDSIRWSSVKSIIYDPSLEEKVLALQSLVNREDMVFTKTDLFNP